MPCRDSERIASYSFGHVQQSKSVFPMYKFSFPDIRYRHMEALKASDILPDDNWNKELNKDKKSNRNKDAYICRCHKDNGYHSLSYASSH